MRSLIVEEAQLRRLCPVDMQALATVEDAFRWHAEGRVDMPPIMHIGVAEHRGDIDIKGAYVRGLENLTIKLGSGFFDNPGLGLPSSSSIMVVLSAKTGLCEALLLENGYLTNLRTGLAGAVAAKYLARRDVTSVGVLGAGAQARFQIECLRLVRGFSTVRVWSRNAATAHAYADEMRAQLGIEVVACVEAEEVVRSSQIVVTTTPSTAAIVHEDWLQEGTHVTAVGSDAPAKQELSAGCLRKADLVVCDSISQCAVSGELHHALLQQVVRDASQASELGPIVAGQIKVDRADRDITVCDLTGMGVQDTAIAWYALRRHRVAAER